MNRSPALTAYLAFTGLFVVGFVVQLFLASLGMMGAESYEAHKTVGFTVMHGLSLLAFVAALISPTRKRDAPWAFAFFLLVTVTLALAGARDDHPWIAAFHPLFALGSTGMAFWLHMRARRPYEPQARAAAAT